MPQFTANSKLANCALWFLAFVVFITASQFARASDYVLVVDVSGSMVTKVSNRDNRVRIKVVQDALSQYLPALPQGSRVRLIAFSSGIVSDKEVILKQRDDLPEALAWVNGLAEEARKNKQTHLWTTLRHALQIASGYSAENPEQPVTVRALTDGADNEGVTTLDQVLREFQTVLDGQHVRGNLVLLGDLELKTKLPVLSLPDGAFETTTNVTWTDIFPPIVLWTPQDPCVGDEVKMFENTASIYASYEWFVDNRSVGREKVLSWRFAEPRNHRISLKVKGLQGSPNSATISIRVRAKAELTVDFTAPAAAAEPGQTVELIARASSEPRKFEWQVNSLLSGTNQEMAYLCEKEGRCEIKLTVWSADGRTASKTRVMEVQEKPLTAQIVAPSEAMSGMPVRFASQFVGPCAFVEWSFGDGTTSTEKNPLHSFAVRPGETNTFNVELRAASPQGHTAVADSHVVRVIAPAQTPAPKAAFRILDARLRVGDRLRLVDESTGFVEVWQWDINGVAASQTRNPEHVLDRAGEMLITLKVKGPGGTSDTVRKIIVHSKFESVTVQAGASPKSGVAPLAVQFTSMIGGDCRAFLWVFGDGQSSTNNNPRHTYGQVTNCAAVLTAYPADTNQPPVEVRVGIQVLKPKPIWAKVLPFVGCSLLLGLPAAALLRRKRQRALQLSVYYWPETCSVCRSIAFTHADEARELTPDAPVRIKRAGKSSTLVVEPVNGAVLLSSDGQELTVQTIGQGARILVRAESSLPRAVAISAVQKPGRPSPASPDSEPFSETAAPSPAAHGDFAWEWEATEPTKTN
ncbi:MAG: VWA domain-containing protein [Verrucomicrobia bacterium]|nr:VWA domain-containing protein [Verrucomicrobiota bacterium]